MKTREDIAWLPTRAVVTCPHDRLADGHTVLRQQNRGASELVYRRLSTTTYAL